jgi:hypothetical protein
VLHEEVPLRDEDGSGNSFHYIPLRPRFLSKVPPPRSGVRTVTRTGGCLPARIGA